MNNRGARNVVRGTYCETAIRGWLAKNRQTPGSARHEYPGRDRSRRDTFHIPRSTFDAIVDH